MEAEGFVLCYVVGVSHGLKERVGLHQGSYLLSFFFFMVVINRLKVEVRQVTNDNVICNESSEQVEGPWRGRDVLRREGE